MKKKKKTSRKERTFKERRNVKLDQDIDLKTKKKKKNCLVLFASLPFHFILKTFPFEIYNVKAPTLQTQNKKPDGAMMLFIHLTRK